MTEALPDWDIITRRCFDLAPDEPISGWIAAFRDSVLDVAEKMGPDVAYSWAHIEACRVLARRSH